MLHLQNSVEEIRGGVRTASGNTFPVFLCPNDSPAADHVDEAMLTGSLVSASHMISLKAVCLNAPYGKNACHRLLSIMWHLITQRTMCLLLRSY